MGQGPHGTGPTRRRLMFEKDHVRAKMEQEQSKRNRARERKRKQTDIASEESKAKAKRVWQILAQHFAHFLKLFRRLLCHLHRYILSPAPSTYTLHMVTMDIYLHICGYSSVRGILCACVFLVYVQLYMSGKLTRCEHWSTLLWNSHLAVPCRNRMLFRCVLWSHCCVWSAILLNFR